MGYRELIKKVQLESGFSDAESKDALDMTVEAIAGRLTEEECEDFASQLPTELQDIALHAERYDYNDEESLIRAFMDKEKIEEGHAKKQILSAWAAIKSLVSAGEIKDIKSQLPNKVASFLV